MIPVRLEDYRDVAPRGSIDLLLRLAERLKGRRFVHVNASRFGSGSAEILGRMVPILQDLGIAAAWEVVVGDPEFYASLRALDSALAGEAQEVSEGMLRSYGETAAANFADLPLEADLVMVHDLAPLPMARRRPSGGRWIWRCHADLSRAYRRAWHTVRRELERYDAAVFSLPKFTQRLPAPIFIVHPSVDPLSEKNRDLTRAEVQRVLDRLQVPRDKPLLLQVAPYARSKDPSGVIQAYRLAKRYVDCRLVLAGSGGADNPEGSRVLAEVRDAAAHDPDIQVLVLPPEAALEINALQRAAAVLIHKPLQEDFGLIVAEAMWKGKPVIGSMAGGIPAQVIFEVTGYTVNSVEGAAFRIRQLLQNPDLMARLGGAAREYVRRNFLITRQVGDNLALLANLTG
ncbi:MAG TPA: glycosyltransferase [Candidatus Methylomirabilis sp.]|nr:glycosyltransferase [Candidatus Methylomirabilis sp.]